MKYTNKIIVLLLLIAIVVVITTSLNSYEKKPNEDLIRIHIRANSNSDYDQNLKHIVKDNVVNYLTPLLANANSKDEAISILNSNLPKLNQKVNYILNLNNVDYEASTDMVVEEFPTRKYGDMVVEKGVYDSLVVTLGEGKGDNWWCVAFPPLCFIPDSGENIRYKSKILEIISNAKNS